MRIVVRGFVLIGAVSTVVWAVTLFTAKHHQPIWELLSGGLACFLVAALAEVGSLKGRVAQLEGRLDREMRRDDLLGVVDRLTRECQNFQGTMDDFGRWLAQGEHDIAQYSLALATEFARQHQREVVGPLIMAIPIRLDKLHDIRRAVMTPGSHLGKGAAGV
jgi:hypothetical protein